MNIRVNPILIFTGSLHPRKRIFERFMRDFGKPSFVIAADSGLVCAEKFGFTPDLIVGDMDSLTDNTFLNRYPKEKIRVFERDKDESDTVLALCEAYKVRGSSENRIILCGGDGGRIDHFLAIVKQFEREFFPDVWLCRGQAVYNLRSCGDGRSHVLALAAHRCQKHISVFPVPVFCSPCRIVSQGLVWPLESVDWEHGGFSLSNRAACEYVRQKRDVVLTAEHGAFIVIVPY